MGSAYSYVKDHKLAFLSSIGLVSIVGSVWCKRKWKGSSSEIIQRSEVQQYNKQQYILPQQENSYPARKSTYMLDDMEKTLYTTMSKAGKIDLIIDNIRVNFIANSECLEPQTIVDILQNTVELAGDEFVSCTQKNRLLRRNYRKQGKVNQYQSTIIKYNDDIEEILERAQAELLNRLDIPKDIFEESMLTLMDRGFFQQLYMLQASVKQKIKEKIQSKKDLTVKQVKDIIRFNIKVLRERPEPMNCIVTRMANNQEYRELVPNAINLMIQDLIYNNFGVEEEDQIRNIQKPECMGDSEIHQLLGSIEVTMSDFMNSIGLGGIDHIPESLETFI